MFDYAALDAAVAPYKVLRRVFFMEEMLKNAFGKVLRNELAKQ